MSRRTDQDRESALDASDDLLDERRPELAPGKRTLTQRLGHVVQRSPADAAAHRARLDSAWASTLRPSAADVQTIADAGVAGPGSELPYLDLIQESFGPAHDLSDVRAHVGGAGGEAAKAIGARAYATGTDVAFDGPPDLHTAAHEATHVVQQRQGVHLAGGIGQAGDSYEQQADRVADAVVRGESAASWLPARAPGGGRAVQRQEDDSASYAARAESEAAAQESGSHPDAQDEIGRARHALERAERIAIPLHVRGRDEVDPATASHGGQLLARAVQLASESVVRAQQQLEPGDPKSVALSRKVSALDAQLSRITLEHGPALGINRFRGEPVPGALFENTGDPAADIAREVRRLRAPLQFAQRTQSAEGSALRALAADLPGLKVTLEPGQRAFLDHVLDVLGLQAKLDGIALGPAEQGVDRLTDLMGMPSELRPTVKQQLPMQLTDDVLASLNRCPPHIAAALAEEWEAFREAWYIAAGFLGAELVSIALSTSPSPHLQLVGAILQAVMLALAVQGLVDTVGEIQGTVHHALAWYRTIRSADGNSAKINVAASHLGHVAAKVLLAILKALPIRRLFGRRKARELGEGESVPEAKTHRDGLDPDSQHERPHADPDADTSAHETRTSQDSDTPSGREEATADRSPDEARAESDLAKRRHAEEAQRRREAAAAEEPDTRTTHERREDEQRAEARERREQRRNKTMANLGVSDEGANALSTLANVKKDPVGDINSVGNKNHYSAARREAAGDIVARRADGRPYSHIGDLQQARDALDRVVRVLAREKDRLELTPRGADTLAKKHKEAMKLLNRLQAFLGEIGHGESTPPYHSFPNGGNGNGRH